MRRLLSISIKVHAESNTKYIQQMLEKDEENNQEKKGRKTERKKENLDN